MVTAPFLSDVFCTFLYRMSLTFVDSLSFTVTLVIFVLSFSFTISTTYVSLSPFWDLTTAVAVVDEPVCTAWFPSYMCVTGLLLFTLTVANSLFVSTFSVLFVDFVTYLYFPVMLSLAISVLFTNILAVASCDFFVIFSRYSFVKLANSPGPWMFIIYSFVSSRFVSSNSSVPTPVANIVLSSLLNMLIIASSFSDVISILCSAKVADTYVLYALLLSRFSSLLSTFSSFMFASKILSISIVYVLAVSPSSAITSTVNEFFPSMLTFTPAIEDS